MPLDPTAEKRIDAVFSQAAASGRRMLHEYEVYLILAALGLRTPRHAFIADPDRMNADVLSPFRPRAVIKIVSPDIAHKSKLGGVKVIAVDDPLYVRFVMHAMRAEVLAHFPETAQPRVDGFLIAEFVPFTQAIGNETLIGVKEDPAFGPVVTLSKGGDDAEFFAKWYDPANLALAPLDRREADDLTHRLKIRHKFEAEGHGDYCAKMGEALYAISQLAYRYSFIAETPALYHLTQLDVNPFVFSADGDYLAVDGYARFTVAEERACDGCRPAAESLRAFFEPEGIAVAGVSGDAGKYSMARIIVEILADLGRTDVFCLNPKGGRAEVDGRSFPLYRSPAELPRKCDLFVFAAPAAHTVDFLDTVPDGAAVILISGLPPDFPAAGFLPVVRRQRERGVRVIGPNCMGVFFAAENRRGVNTLFLGEDRLRMRWTAKSNVALFTQSGAMGITAVERAQNAPIYRTIVSFGNKSDVDLPELIRYFSAEPSVAVLASYLEGLGPGEGRSFFEAAKATDKPIILYKAGRTAAGARAAASHTAALSGDYDIFRAASDQAGVVLIDELPDFYHAVKAFAMLADKGPRGLRVAGVVNAGLDATMGADLLGALTPAAYSASTLERLAALNEHGLMNVGASFLDVTPMTGDRMFAGVVEAVLTDPGTDCAFIAIVPHVETLKTTNELCAEPDALANLLVQAAARTTKPIVVSVNAGNHYQGLVRVLEKGGLPVFPDIRSAMRALETFCVRRLASG